MQASYKLERVTSPIGTLLLVTDAEEKLHALHWAEDEAELHERFSRHHDAPLREAGKSASARRALEAYFAGELAAIEAIPVAMAGTEFQRCVWAALRQIPAGETLSYGALAAKIGRPRASRAVGMANNANPIGIVVPCHRVIGADATLTGYGGGLDRKRWLLTHEGAHYLG